LALARRRRRSWPWRFGPLAYEVLERQALEFRCSCSRDRSLQALRLMEPEDLLALLAEGETVVDCHFCHAPLRVRTGRSRRESCGTKWLKRIELRSTSQARGWRRPRILRMAAQPLLLEALARVNAIGRQHQPHQLGDTAGVDATLRLIVESASR